MTLIHCVAYTSFIACCVAIIKSENHAAVTSFVFFVETCAMAACLTYSMVKLGEFSTMLGS